MKNISLLAFSAALLISIAPSFSQEAAPARKDPVQDTVAELVKKGFNTFVAALVKTDYLDKLAAETFTVVAPTDVAFRDLPKAQLDALLADKMKLTELLSHHIIEGKVSSTELKSGTVKTLAGTTVEAKLVDGKLKIGAATMVRLDIPSTNGVIHGVDKFLKQP